MGNGAGIKWNYHDLYKKYDMRGEIRVGRGVVKVHDIFDKTPEFMKSADVVFSDPPCSFGNLRSFYTKAEIEERANQYLAFQKRFFEVIDEIKPRLVFLEVFKANKDAFEAELGIRYKNIAVYDSMYYKNPKNKCWIIVASNDPLPEINLSGIDEELVIEKICNEIEFNCIADPCIGKGLVAFYASKAGKAFVGTELNEKRLAVCVERVTTGERGRIN